MTERARFESIVARDGLDEALRFERENVVQTYRKVVLSRFGHSPKMTLYRRVLIEHYAEAKRILREHKEIPC